MSAAALPAGWRGDVTGLLDNYLARMGVVSAAVRSRWGAAVVESLVADQAGIAADDIREEAVERLRDAIRARLATLGNIDPVRERREIARRLLVLQAQRNSELLNAIFADTAAIAGGTLAVQLDAALAAAAPCPVPPEAPLAMPVQVIELRPLNPLRFFRWPR